MFKAIIITVSITIFLFSFGVFIFDFGDWKKLSFYLLFGLFIGLIATPEIDPKSFKTPWIFQSICGLIAGTVFGFGLDFESTNLLASIIIGGFLGWSAPFWLKYMTIP